LLPGFAWPCVPRKAGQGSVPLTAAEPEAMCALTCLRRPCLASVPPDQAVESSRRRRRPRFKASPFFLSPVSTSTRSSWTPLPNPRLTHASRCPSHRRLEQRGPPYPPPMAGQR
jgi:hypothetical protein